MSAKKPERPTNAYTKFKQDRLAKNKALSDQALRTLWTSDPSIAQRYQAEFAAANVVYKKALTEWNAAHENSESDAESKGPTPPKRPSNAYFLFSQAERAKAAEADPKAKLGASKLSDMWKEADDEAKKPFVEKAAALKTEWDAAMKQFKETNPDWKPQRKKSNKRKKTMGSSTSKKHASKGVTRFLNAGGKIGFSKKGYLVLRVPTSFSKWVLEPFHSNDISDSDSSSD